MQRRRAALIAAVVVLLAVAVLYVWATRKLPPAPPLPVIPPGTDPATASQDFAPAYVAALQKSANDFYDAAGDVYDINLLTIRDFNYPLGSGIAQAPPKQRNAATLVAPMITAQKQLGTQATNIKNLVTPWTASTPLSTLLTVKGAVTGLNNSVTNLQSQLLDPIQSVIDFSNAWTDYYLASKYIKLKGIPWFPPYKNAVLQSTTSANQAGKNVQTLEDLKQRVAAVGTAMVALSQSADQLYQFAAFS